MERDIIGMPLSCASYIFLLKQTIFRVDNDRQSQVEQP